MVAEFVEVHIKLRGDTGFQVIDDGGMQIARLTWQGDERLQVCRCGRGSVT